MSDIRVLHLINGEHYAGAERVQDLLAEWLKSEGIEVGFACLKPGRFDSARHAQSVPLWNVPMRSRWDWSVVSRIVDLIRTERFQLVHTHTTRGALVGSAAARRAATPLVHHFHSPTARDTEHRWRNWLNSVIERRALREAAQLLAVSTSVAAWLRETGYDSRRITVVPNGVPSLDHLPPRSPPTGRWTLGALGLWRPRKGLETLLDAVARLRSTSDGADVALRVVGPWETPEYERHVHDHVARLELSDLVEFRGFTTDTTSELLQFNTLVLPSLYGEGLPMVVLEAMARGVPVVASRCEGLSDVIRHDVDGLLVEPGDAEDLARQLARLIRGDVDPESLRFSAWRRQCAEFSAMRVARDVAAAYRSILG